MIRRVEFSAAARRHQPFYDFADGRKLAAYMSGQPRRTDALAAVNRLCLSAVPLYSLGAWQGRLKNGWRRAAAENPTRR